jgi:hypothetical protein
MVALAVLGLAAASSADDREHRSGRDESRAVAAKGVTKTLEDLGYRVSKIEFEDGCLELRAVNESGFPIKAVYDTKSGELIRAKLK